VGTLALVLADTNTELTAGFLSDSPRRDATDFGIYIFVQILSHSLSSSSWYFSFPTLEVTTRIAMGVAV
jgi:hypothetical protein